ncbi:MAG: right-handed parallel beta-helix repeat-containing protein [Ignavibacteriaceae bacterium]|nr:right-handed parallel beta-helix repeat-containing protein [Ignavibacteriaceae bacterium]
MRKSLLLFVLLFAVFFSYTVIAQELGSIRKGYEITIPQKINKLVLDPLPGGTYSVGTGGYFPTIDSAFNKLSIDGIAGEVILELIDDLYTAPADSFGFQLIGPITGAGLTSKATIKPAANKNVTIEGNGRYVITFKDVSYLNLDGVSTSGNTTLYLHVLSNTQFNGNNGVGFFDNSDNNVIKNLIVNVEDYQRISAGIFVGGGTNPQFAPDENIIMNNFIKKAGIAIYLRNTTANIIKGNNIGSETDSLISWGIQSEITINTLIENNHVQNLRYGIAYECPGIDSYLDNGCTIRNNIVHNIDGGDARDGGYGIELSGDIGNPGINNIVYNNMVYDIRGSSNRIAGIQLWYVNNSKIYYNSVKLAGNGSGTVTNGSAALYISHSSTNIEVKNNILVNTRDESPYSASSIYDYSASNLTSDYNDLFYETNQNNCLVRIGSTNYITLAEWQATLNDVNSHVEMPHFVEPYLHIDENIETYLESTGTPIAGIEKDFDGDTRNISTPDIGADEFAGIPVGVENDIQLPTEFALEQNYPNPFNPSTIIKYSVPQTSQVQIKVFDVLGNEIETLFNEEKSVGTYELIWNAANLPSGVYFYQLKAGEFISTKKMLLLK